MFLFNSINKKKLNFFKIKFSTLNYSGLLSRINTSKYTSGTEILELFIRQGIILVMAFSYTFVEIAILAVLLRVSDAIFLISTSLMSIYSNKISSNNEKIRSTGIKKINNFNFISICKNELTSKALGIMEGGDKKVLVLPVVENEKVIGALHLHHIISSNMSSLYL